MKEGLNGIPSLTEVMEIARRPKRPILTAEFASRIRGITDDFSDDLRIGDLRIPPKHIASYEFRASGFLQDCKPPAKWKEFYESLPHQEKSQLSRALGYALYYGYETLGSIRRASLVPNPGDEYLYLPHLGNITSVFLKMVFPEPIQQEKS